jgi:hypothetical protein
MRYASCSALLVSLTLCSYSVMFTLNTFLSLVFQSVTQTLIGHSVWHLRASGKYRVLAVQLLAVSILFAAIGAYAKLKDKQWTKRVEGTGSDVEADATHASGAHSKKPSPAELEQKLLDSSASEAHSV